MRHPGPRSPGFWYFCYLPALFLRSPKQLEGGGGRDAGVPFPYMSQDRRTLPEVTGHGMKRHLSYRELELSGGKGLGQGGEVCPAGDAQCGTAWPAGT